MALYLGACLDLLGGWCLVGTGMAKVSNSSSTAVNVAKGRNLDIRSGG